MSTLALVTGATSGIGKALCHLLAENGINLIATGRDAEQLQQLEKELASKVDIIIETADLSRKEDRARLIAIIRTSTPDLVINNAGFGLYGDMLSYPTEDQLAILEVNGIALVEIMVEAARAMITKGIRGRILNVSSAAAFQIFPGMAMYAASKAFVNHISQSLDWEMRSHGIRILAVCPGMVSTRFRQRAGGEEKGQDKSGVMTPEYVANEIWKQIQSCKSLRIVDWRYRLLTYLSYLVPTSLKLPLLKKSIPARTTGRHTNHHES